MCDWSWECTQNEDKINPIHCLHPRPPLTPVHRKYQASNSSSEMVQHFARLMLYSHINLYKVCPESHWSKATSESVVPSSSEPSVSSLESTVCPSCKTGKKKKKKKNWTNQTFIISYMHPFWLCSQIPWHHYTQGWVVNNFMLLGLYNQITKK